MIFLTFPFTCQELFERRMLSLTVAIFLKQTFQITEHGDYKELSGTKQISDHVLKINSQYKVF